MGDTAKRWDSAELGQLFYCLLWKCPGTVCLLLFHINTDTGQWTNNINWWHSKKKNRSNRTKTKLFLCYNLLVHDVKIRWCFGVLVWRKLKKQGKLKAWISCCTSSETSRCSLASGRIASLQCSGLERKREGCRKSLFIPCQNLNFESFQKRYCNFSLTKSKQVK